MKTKVILTFLVLFCNGTLLMGQKKYWLQKGLDATDPKEKIEYFTKSVEKEGVDAAVFTNRGIAYGTLLRYEDAIDDFTKAIEIDPKLAKVYAYRGNAYSGLKQYENAIADYTKAIEIDPKYAAAFNNRGLAYKKLNQYAQAIADYSNVIEIDPKSADAYGNRGTAYSCLKQKDKAIADYTKAIEIDPKSAVDYCNRGNAYVDIKEYYKAIADCSKAIEIEPKNANAYGNRGTAYGSLKQYDKAIADYTKAIEIEPKNAVFYYNRGITYSFLDQYNNAITDYTKAIEIDPNYTNAVEARKNALEKLPPMPPILIVSEISLIDSDKNNRIDGNENCYLSFTITNKGIGSANYLKAVIKNNSNVSGLSFDNPVIIGTIAPFDFQMVKIPINGTINLTTGSANINVSFEEQKGFPPDPFDINIATRAFLKPDVKVVDNSFLTDNGTIKLGYPIQLKTLIQNVGQGIAENVNISFTYTSSNIFSNGQKDFEIGTIQAGSSKEIVFDFFVNKLYSEKTIPISINLTEKYGKYGETKQVSANLDMKSAGTTINISSDTIDNMVNIQVASLSADIDKNIPQNANIYPNRYALIIGNEDYTVYNSNISPESNVPFARNDALSVKEYAIKTFGVPDENVILLLNAGQVKMKTALTKMKLLAKISSGKAELIFYYAGHGLPDENTKEPYIIPVDVSGNNLSYAIKLKDVYKELSEYPSERITIFLDACFSGGARDQTLLAVRGVRIKPQEEFLKGNMVVFSASNGEQSASAYKEKMHGMFTYYLLKKLQETNGNVTYNELGAYLNEKVSLKSVLINEKEQNPQTLFSLEIQGKWENWTLK